MPLPSDYVEGQTGHLDDHAQIAAALAAPEVSADSQLTIRNRGEGALAGLIKFESDGLADEPTAPWILQVANAGEQRTDHVFHHLYNCIWSDVDQSWTRLLAGEAAYRFGYETRWGDSEGMLGQFEWNLDIDPGLAEDLAFPRRPWFFWYDMDEEATYLQLGDIADRARNVFRLYGAITDVSGLAMKRGADALPFLQISSSGPTLCDIDSGDGVALRLNPYGTGRITLGKTDGPTVIIKASVSNEGNTFGIYGYLQWTDPGKAQATVGAAGTASDIPGAPEKWLRIQDHTGEVMVIPCWRAS